MSSLIIAKDAPQNPPDPIPTVPGAPAKCCGSTTKAANADDGGALWWDHDDPGLPGTAGIQGLPGIPGIPGAKGGDTPDGITITISDTIIGNYALFIVAGKGQPGGQGGKGGTGGEGQDGGDSDDEQPAGLGGKGGNGGAGGNGGNGGDGGTINQVTVIRPTGVPINAIDVQYTIGLGAPSGLGGPGGDPGIGGQSGSGGPGRAPNGDPGVPGASGSLGRNGDRNTVIILG